MTNNERIKQRESVDKETIQVQVDKTISSSGKERKQSVKKLISLMASGMLKDMNAKS